MPIYEYECIKCEKEYEILFKTMGGVKKDLPCPKCGRKLNKLISIPQRAIIQGGTDRALAWDKHYISGLEAMSDYNERMRNNDVSASEVLETAEIEKEEMAKRGKQSGPRKPLRTKTDIDSFRAAGRKKVSENRKARSASWF